MKKRILTIIALATAFIAVVVAQTSAASACIWSNYDPELPERLR